MPPLCGRSTGQERSPIASIVLAPEVNHASLIPCSARIAAIRSRA
jgi:hypothetical protein